MCSKGREWGKPYTFLVIRQTPDGKKFIPLVRIITIMVNGKKIPHFFLFLKLIGLTMSSPLQRDEDIFYVKILGNLGNRTVEEFVQVAA